MSHMLGPSPSCIQCGMCCMVAICGFGEEVPPGPTNECGYLTVDEDDNAVCNCKEAVETFVGSGCMFQRGGMADLYLLHLNEYNIDERLHALKEACYEFKYSRDISV